MIRLRFEESKKQPRPRPAENGSKRVGRVETFLEKIKDNTKGIFEVTCLSIMMEILKLIAVKCI